MCFAPHNHSLVCDFFSRRDERTDDRTIASASTSLLFVSLTLGGLTSLLRRSLAVELEFFFSRFELLRTDGCLLESLAGGFGASVEFFCVESRRVTSLAGRSGAVAVDERRFSVVVSTVSVVVVATSLRLASPLASDTCCGSRSCV